jgi:hypothetical protein
MPILDFGQALKAGDVGNKADIAVLRLKFARLPVTVSME